MKRYLEILRLAFVIYHDAWIKILNNALDIIYDFIAGEEKDAS